MKKISIISNDKVECGVYNFGHNVYEILTKSKNYSYEFVAVANLDQFINWFSNASTDGMLFNYHPSTLPWINEETLACLQSHPKFLITGHDYFNSFNYIEHNFVCDPTFAPVEKFSPFPRPVLFNDKIQYSLPGKPIKIGSFGFARGSKRFPELVQMVNNEFKDPVEINLHLTIGYYVENAQQQLLDIVHACKNIAAENVTINFSHHYVDNLELLKFLNNNDINIFNCMDAAGISSSIDFALASKKPIGIGSSHMYRHMNWKREISINHTSIMDIINQGISPLQEFYEQFSHENLILSFENIFDSFV